MDIDVFLTVASDGEFVLRERMSRFLAFVYGVGSRDEARERIGELSRRFHDARHVCWAFVLGPDGDDCLSSDNGEPSGTAGRPILSQIKSLGLTDVLVVVVRYFGGIKLGTSGLIGAYRGAARGALEVAGVEKRRVMRRLWLRVGYEGLNGVMRVVKSVGLKILSQEYEGMVCVMHVEVGAGDCPRVEEVLESVGGVSYWYDEHGGV